MRQRTLLQGRSERSALFETFELDEFASLQWNRLQGAGSARLSSTSQKPLLPPIGTCLPTRAVDYPTSMIDRERLELIRRASLDGDWALAGEAYIELSLAASGSTDSFCVEAIAPHVRLRDAEGLAAVIDELLARKREKQSSDGTAPE